MHTDTIAAIATALSDSGIGIIRISGSEAIEVGNRVFRTPGGKQILKDVPSHTIHYGYICSSISDKGSTAVFTDDVSVDSSVVDYEILDEVMVSVMKAPKSFTAEDTVEINCHGGVLVMQKILDLVCSKGARMAEPGEFTKRAFLNGRIDLSRAEAVMDVIHSQSELSLKTSINHLQGQLYNVIKLLRDKLIYEIAYIESALDDPEHFDLENYPEELKEKIFEIQKKIDGLIATSINGILIKEGISTVILGKPNAGKSSLMNMLLKEDRAIVTDIAGTTRDALKESIKLNGISLNIIDTAGIRDTEDIVEQIGVEKAKKYAEDADLILCVVDISVELDESDKEIFELIKDKKSIILLNKTDLEQVISEEDIRNLVGENTSFVYTSTKDGSGMEELENTVKEMFFAGMIKSNNELVITNLRHKKALEKTSEALGLVLNSIEVGMPEDFYYIDLMSAYTSLGLIIGEEVEDDLMEEIFTKFCMGK